MRVDALSREEEEEEKRGGRYKHPVGRWLELPPLFATGHLKLVLA